ATGWRDARQAATTRQPPRPPRLKRINVRESKRWCCGRPTALSKSSRSRSGGVDGARGGEPPVSLARQQLALPIEARRRRPTRQATGNVRHPAPAQVHPPSPLPVDGPPGMGPALLLTLAGGERDRARASAAMPARR